MAPAMRIWPHEPRAELHRATVDDIEELNRVFSDSFTDRYRKDGLAGVRVPQLNPEIWRYALLDAGEGAMIWRDERDTLVAFNIAHYSGSEGWMGPLAVRSDRQGKGLGRVIVQEAINWLRERRAATIGLETMPRTVDNIGFYGGLGFEPGYLTVTFSGDAENRSSGREYVLLSDLPDSRRKEVLDECQVALERVAPGYDYTREHNITLELGVGDTTVLTGNNGVRAFALWHSAPLAVGRWDNELRVLKLFADSAQSFDELMLCIEACAVRRSMRRVSVRCQTAFPDAYRSLIRLGYRVRWTDLRMTLRDYPEQNPADGAVVLSNWEI